MQAKPKEEELKQTPDLNFQMEDRIIVSEQANTFSLTVELQKGLLKLTLKDYVQWRIYSKTYTDEDIGKEINRKIELFDILSALPIPQKNNDEGRMEKYKKMRVYEFGNSIKNSKSSEYIVNKGGVIIVFTKVSYERNNKKSQQYAKSQLRLQKVSQFKQLQIFMTKSQIQTRLMSQKLQQEIASLTIDKFDLIQRIQKLQKQNKQLKESQKILMQQKDLTKIHISQLRKKIEQMQLKLQQNCNNVKINTDKTISQVSSAIKTMNQQFKQNSYNLKISLKQELQKEIAQIKTQNMKNMKISTQFFDQKKQMIDKLYKFNQLSMIVDRKNSFHDRFEIMGSIIKYGSRENGNYTQILIDQVVPQDKIYKFKVKVLNLPNVWMTLGITDRKKTKTTRSTYSSGNTICWLSSGYRYPDGATGFGGFGAGNTIQVIVNIEAMSVQWVMDGQQKKYTGINILSDKKREFVPYMQLVYTGDSVEWLGRQIIDKK